MNKSVLEYFNSIADTKMKNALIANSKANQLNTRVDHLWQAIITAFVWVNSPEGMDYWQSISEDAMNGKIEII